MANECDYVLFGTGLAPLVAAKHFLLQGKSVILLNPDLDFFLEDSELPLDPLLHGKINAQRILENTIERAMEVIRPVYPGSIELWSSPNEKEGYYDPSAPHLRQRGRLWISSFSNPHADWSWEQLEDLYVEASDAHLKPQILEGLPAIRRFPGVAANTDHFRGLFIPKLCDIEIARYRSGILEFIRERLPPDQLLCDVSQVEVVENGIRYHAQGAWKSVQPKESFLVFWTPRMTQWLTQQSKKLNFKLPRPKGIRVWEQWSLNSREQPAPATVGLFENMVVWADFDGLPRFSSSKWAHESPETSRLAVLRAGPLLAEGESDSQGSEQGWVSQDSLGALNHLCYDFLKWSQFSIRSLRAKAIFEWDARDGESLTEINPKFKIVRRCDGPLVQILRSVRSACEERKGD